MSGHVERVACVVGAVLGVLALACGGLLPEDLQQPPGGDDAAQVRVVEPLRCEGFSLKASRGQPTDTIALDVQTAGAGELRWMFAEIRAGAHETLATIGPIDDDGTPGLTVPFHPDGAWTGGEVTVRLRWVRPVEEGAAAQEPTIESCPGEAALTVEPLERAPGTMRRVMDGFEALWIAQAARFGVDEQGLRELPEDQLPVALWGPARALYALNDPRNPSSLLAHLEHTAPNAQPFHEGLEITEAVLARMGFVEHLEATRAALDALGPIDPIEVEAAPISAPPEQGLSTHAQALVSCSGSVRRVKIDSTTQLSQLMRLAQRNVHKAQDRDYDLANKALGAMALAPPLAIKVAAHAMSFVLIEIKHGALQQAGVLPTILGEGQVTLSHEVFDEDHDRVVHGPGEWSDLRVKAASVGWNSADLKIDRAWLAANVAIDLKGGLNGAGLTRGGPIADFNELLKASYGGGQSAQTSGAVLRATDLSVDTLFGKALADVQNDSSKRYVNDNLREILSTCTIPPLVWGPFDLSDQGDHVVELTEGVIEQALPTRQGYRGYYPVDWGSAKMRFAPHPDRFPPARNKASGMVVKQLRVPKLRVTVPSGTVRPGESRTVTAYVAGAHDKSLRWEVRGVPGATIEAGPFDAQGNPTAILTAPASMGEDDRLELRAISAANTGPRAGKITSDVRDGYGFFGSRVTLKVAPGEICLEPGDVFLFEAFHNDERGDQEARVRWSADAGEIGAAGGYRAPDRPGVAKITATSLNHPDVKSTATVKIGGCACAWSAVLNGAVQTALHATGGVSASYRDVLLNISMHDGKGGQVVIQAFSETPIVPGVAGSYPTNVAVSLEGKEAITQTWQSAFVMRDDAQPMLEISSWEKGKIEATLQAPVVLGESIIDSAPRQAQASVHVRAYISEATDLLGAITNVCPGVD